MDKEFSAMPKSGLDRGSLNVLRYMTYNNYAITARAALADLDITSASLARRITSLERFGYEIKHHRMVNPTTKKRFTKYEVTGFKTAPVVLNTQPMLQLFAAAA